MKTVFLKGLCGLSLVMMPEIVLSSSKDNLKSVSPHQYTHLIETYQSQTFEPLSQTALFPEQSASVSSFAKVAKVYFITNDSGQVFNGLGAGGSQEFEDPTATRCKYEKYTLTSCTDSNPADFCPYNNNYFKTCCDKSYAYTSENCSLLNTTSSCGGKYKCDCTAASYPVTINGCTTPQVPASGNGKSCTVNGQVRYTECICPETYRETCSGTNIQGKGTGCTKNGTTKFVSCECKAGYSQTCSTLGSSPKNTSDYCELNGTRYYKECNVCPFKCSVATKLPGVIYEHEVCSDKYCPLRCNEEEGYINYCTKPETNCAKLGYTKSVSQCPRGYLACPYNSATVFCDD